MRNLRIIVPNIVPVIVLLALLSLPAYLAFAKEPEAPPTNSAPANSQPAESSPASTIIKADDHDALHAAIGKEIIVEGTITSAQWSRSGKVMNINFDGSKKAKFMAVIFERDRAKFDESFKGDAAKTLTGAKVKFKGKLDKYGGKSESLMDYAQIVLKDTNQVTVVELAPTASPSTKPAE